MHKGLSVHIICSMAMSKGLTPHAMSFVFKCRCWSV